MALEGFSKFFSRKKATADAEAMTRIFSAPERPDSTLSLIEKEISANIQGFLNQHIVSGDQTPQELEKDFIHSEIPENPVFVSEQADFLLSKVVAQSVHTSSPAFIGHMTSALPYFMLPLAKIMMALNQNLVKIETSKAFTPLERQVISMLHRLVYEQAQGFYDQYAQDRYSSLGSICSGGTTANITGLWLARNRLFAKRGAFAGVQEDGLASALLEYGFKGAVVLVSERGHYSLRKSADLLGIGRSSLLPIPTDQDNKISMPALEQKIEELKSQKKAIIALVGIAGTTETGNVDPLDKMADLAQRESIYFHVDAAWGGPTLFSQDFKHLLKGIERADSVCIDAHKQLYVPIGAGVLLVKDRTAMNSIEQSANYVIRKGSRDLGKRTLEGSRPGMAMLIHSGLRVMGKKGYELLINDGINKAKRFAETIASQPDFELISAPELNLLTYRYIPAACRGKDLNDPVLIKKLNQATVDIQKQQRAAGKTFVSRTTLFPQRYNGNETVVFRVVLANPLTTDDILHSVLVEQRAIAKKLHI